LIDNDIKQKGEYQITHALENMKAKGKKFRTQAIEEWLDCGNKKAVVYANQRVLSIKEGADSIATSVQTENSVIIPPCFIDENVVLKNAVIGPHVSIGANSVIEDAIITNSVIQDHVELSNVVLEDSMIGSYANCQGKKADLSISDYSTFQL
jgi:glucose-1-phosphate thymidylyltransferase